MNKKAVLLINLGSPDNSDPISVRRYLKEFLLDPRVIDLPFYVRWPLVNWFIIPRRYKRTSAAYQKIWSEEGSPLILHSKTLALALANELGANYHVEYAMRYGKPNIDFVLQRLKDFDKIIVVPLFPQYSSAASGSAIEKSLNVISSQWNVPEVTILRDFYHHPEFIAAYAEQVNQYIANKQPDVVLFSYHGLPERHIDKSSCTEVCDRRHSCPIIDKKNVYCYRAQCYATSHLIAQTLGLSSNQYLVSFQSRLGRTPWIKPYTDILLPELIQKGLKNIAVVSPSFVADCLETLEEIDIRMRDQWKSLGGNEFTYIPCVNASPRWVAALADMVK